MNIAQTILEQLGGRRFLVMTGAKKLIAHENGLSMRLPGNMCKQRINYLKIVLDPSDTYTMEFGRVWGMTYKIIETISDVYCDMLQDIFTSKTGMETNLGTMGK